VPRLIDAVLGWTDEPHQRAALEWLDDHLSPQQQEGFWEIFNAAPQPKAPLMTDCPAMQKPRR